MIKRDKEHLSIVDCCYFGLRRLNNIIGRKRRDHYLFELIGKSVHLGSLEALKENRRNYDNYNLSSCVYEAKSITHYFGYVCDLIKSGSAINKVSSRLENIIEERTGELVDMGREELYQNNRTFYIIQRNLLLLKSADKTKFYSGIGRRVKEAFDRNKCDIFESYFDKSKNIEGLRTGIVGKSLLKQGELIAGTLRDYLEPDRSN